MKLERTITLVCLTFCIGFIAIRWSQAKPMRETSDRDDIHIQEFLSLENYLHDTRQTNALKQLNDILADDRAMNDAVDLSFTVEVLQSLRDGKTNELLKFFEHHLDADVCVFGSEYRVLPVSFQKQMNLKSLQRARDYRSKYPVTNPDPVRAEEVTNAFKILDHQ
jgi:hypothetical protein